MEDLQRKNRELEGLTQYLRSVIESKDGRISDLEAEVQQLSVARQNAVFELRQQHMQQIAQMSTQIQTLQDLNKKLTNDVNLAMNARAENQFLKQQMNDINAELSGAKLKHQEELQRTREQVTVTRANLASEFHIQLELALNEKVRDALIQLPEQARNALGEKEVLRVQLHKQQADIQEILEENIKLTQKLTDIKKQSEANVEIKDLLARKNAQINKQLLEAKALAEKLQADIQADQQQQQSTKELKQALQKISREKEELISNTQKLHKQKEQILLGLQKAATRLGMDVKCFYVDAYAPVQTQKELPSILKDKNRFIAPEL
ncbi:Conserved_hypothetical protein [Hexamita inflata]|uniref:Uncharacterized protein n=1 Tax=Hexamita inflata TaxID=28002 RepID=A0ABP1IL25_9EUKA